MSFPEELLEAVLARAVLISEAELLDKSMSASNAVCAGVLRVNHTWHRVALPLFYRTVMLRSDDATKLWVRSLTENPALSPLVRNLCLANPEPGPTLPSIAPALGTHRVDTLHLSLREFDSGEMPASLGLTPRQDSIVANLRPRRIVISIKPRDQPLKAVARRGDGLGFTRFAGGPFAQNVARLHCLAEIREWNHAESIVLQFSVPMKELPILKLGKLQQLKELRLHVDLGTFDREAVKQLVSSCAAPTITVVPDGGTLYLLDFQDFVRSDPELRTRIKIAVERVPAAQLFASKARTPLETSGARRRWEL